MFIPKSSQRTLQLQSAQPIQHSHVKNQAEIITNLTVLYLKIVIIDKIITFHDPAISRNNLVSQLMASIIASIILFYFLPQFLRLKSDILEDKRKGTAVIQKWKPTESSNLLFGVYKLRFVKNGQCPSKHSASRHG